MKKQLLLVIMAGLLSSCGGSEIKDPGKIPADDAANPPVNDTAADVVAQFLPDSYWLADNDWHISLIKKDNSTLLVRNEAVAQIIDGHLLWIFDNGGHEGYTQNFAVNCEGAKCRLSFSRFMEEWDAGMATDFQTLELSRAATSWGFPNVQVSTIFSQLPTGKYYRGNMADFNPLAVGTLPVGLQIDAGLIVSTTEWDQGFSFIEELAPDTYLVYANAAENTPFPSSQSQRNWFTLFKLEAGEKGACGDCQCTTYTWRIGDKWNNYRDLVKSDPTFEQYSGVVYRVEPGSCPGALALPFDQITVKDSEHGDWDWLVTGSSVTPFDTRPLNYVEVLEHTAESYLVAYTFGLVQNWDVNDPNRFDYDRYYHLARFTEAANGCYDVDVTDLNTSGTFGLDLTVSMPFHFSACNPVVIDKPEPDPGEITDNPGDDTDNPGDDTDDPSEPSFDDPESFVAARNVDGENWSLRKAKNTLVGTFNNQSVKFEILAVEDGIPTANSHFHFYLVKAMTGHTWNGLAVGAITAIKLYFYETETPYFHLFYGDPMPQLSATSTGLDQYSYKQSIKNFYLK